MRRGQIPNFTLIAEDDSGIKEIRIEVTEGLRRDGFDSGRNDSGMTVLAPTDVIATNTLGQEKYLRVAQKTYDSPIVLQPMQIEISRFTSELVKFTATDFIGNERTTRVYWLPNAFCVDTRPGFP